ncbi:translocon-associated protein subunit delta-like [Homalodisca vitripennis]|uniref:translocon-associated protein subunit delta-like n=1 Tax=Homalodisca vitripennis TaxID=197043 RepID=UPI001EEA5A0E|nr:translocon-associated protein subunit delta-like [Homalodisca vitripennis]
METIRFVLAVFAAFLISSSYGNTCVKPEVTASQYTTQDATVLTSIAYVAEFNLKCANGVKGIPLYAEVSGKTLPAARIGDDNKYQVSWTEDVKKAKSGDYSVNLYDEEGYGALRKAMRSGEDLSTVKPLVTIVVNYPGAYQGPWVNSEFMAAVLSVLVWYLAFSAKSKLLS